MIALIEERTPWAFGGDVAVVDTSVLVDFALQAAERHSDAVSVFTRLIERGVRIRVPYHAAFEFLATVRRRQGQGEEQAKHAGMADTLFVVKVHAVPLNNAFNNHYSMADLPHLRAGDLVFLALARGDSAPLITEDVELHKKALQAGVRSFTMKEYIESESA